MRLIVSVLASAFFVPHAYGLDAIDARVSTSAETLAKAYEKQCPKRGGKGAGTRQEGWKIWQTLPDGSTLLIVDGWKLPCETVALCGTGGCFVQVHRLTKGGNKKLFAAQVLGWELKNASAAHPYLFLDLHGSQCGRLGNDDCHKQLDAKTGKLTIQ